MNVECVLAGFLRVSLPDNAFRFRVDDDHGVRAMPGQGNAEPTGIGRKRGSLTIARERVNDDDGFAFKALCLVRRANQHTGHVGETRRHLPALRAA